MYSNGCTYYGEWNNDLPKGEGVVINKKGEILGAGVFMNGWIKKNGKIIY